VLGVVVHTGRIELRNVHVGRRRARRAVAVAVVAVVVNACARGGDQVPVDEALRSDGMTPTWAPTALAEPGGAVDVDTPTTDPHAAPPAGSAAPVDHDGAGDGAPPADAGASAGQQEAPLTASITDPAGDVRGSLVERPPAWADVLGASLTRSPDRWELRVRVAGGSAPSSSGSDAHAMNLALFVDLDGDGAVDAQVWANLADHGWGLGWFPSEGPNRFGPESGIDLALEGDEVVLRLPRSHLAAERLRWSVASEWGRDETLGSDLAARDQAPDAGPASFP
jgi:hypothetical protein